MIVVFLLAVLIGSTPAGLAQHALASAARPTSTGLHPTRPATGGEHRDHSPKHGGIFFMAMDNHHHLEGVLERPYVFRVYLYDSHTKPLALDKIRQASGTVLVGESDYAPAIPLQLSSDGTTLEVLLDGRTTLPLTLTLRLRFPGMARDAKPELFTFPFREFTKTPSPRPVQQTVPVDGSR